jgi:hypothetical protein
MSYEMGDDRRTHPREDGDNVNRPWTPSLAVVPPSYARLRLQALRPGEATFVSPRKVLLTDDFRLVVDPSEEAPSQLSRFEIGDRAAALTMPVITSEKGFVIIARAATSTRPPYGRFIADIRFAEPENFDEVGCLLEDLSEVVAENADEGGDDYDSGQMVSTLGRRAEQTPYFVIEGLMHAVDGEDEYSGDEDLRGPTKQLAHDADLIFGYWQWKLQ